MSDRFTGKRGPAAELQRSPAQSGGHRDSRSAHGDLPHLPGVPRRPAGALGGPRSVGSAPGFARFRPPPLPPDRRAGTDGLVGSNLPAAAPDVPAPRAA